MRVLAPVGNSSSAHLSQWGIVRVLIRPCEHLFKWALVTESNYYRVRICHLTNFFFIHIVIRNTVFGASVAQLRLYDPMIHFTKISPTHTKSAPTITHINTLVQWMVYELWTLFVEWNIGFWQNWTIVLKMWASKGHYIKRHRGKQTDFYCQNWMIWMWMTFGLNRTAQLQCTSVKNPFIGI